MALDDKFIVIGSYSYIGLSLAVVFLGTIYHLLFGIPDKYWLMFWHGYIWVFFVFTVVLTVWLGLGGFIDLKRLFTVLPTMKRDSHDDGTIAQQGDGQEENNLNV